MMRDVRHSHETSQQPTGSPRQPIAELFDVGAAQRPITIDRPIAVVPRDQRHRPIIAGRVVQGGQILGRRLGGHYWVAALIDVVVDMEAEALGGIAIELPRTPAALGKFAFGESQVHQVVGKTIASEHPDHIGQVGVTAVEGILQMVVGIQKIRHIAANGLIKQNRERRNRLRQRKHVLRPDRLGAGFRRSLELKACALSDQARRRDVRPSRSLWPVEFIGHCTSRCRSGDNQGRHQGNKHSIDRLRLRHSPPTG